RLALAGALAMPRVHMRMPHIRVPRLAMIRARSERPGPDSAQVVALLAHLAAADPGVCELAVDMLGNGWNWGSRWGEISALRDARTPAREARLRYSGSVTDRRALPVLEAALGREQPCVRRAAARLLGGSSLPEASGALRRALTHRDGIVREAALLGLGISEDPGSFTAVLQAVSDRDPEVVRMAAWALGEYEDPRALTPLIRLLDRSEV